MFAIGGKNRIFIAIQRYIAIADLFSQLREQAVRLQGFELAMRIEDENRTFELPPFAAGTRMHADDIIALAANTEGKERRLRIVAHALVPAELFSVDCM